MQEVAYNAAVVENIDANVNKIGLLVLGFTALLLIIAIALINNTIRLAIYSKRFLIRTMHWWVPRNGSSRNRSSDRACGKAS